MTDERRERRAPRVRCVDCGQMFREDDDAARCPITNGIGYHRSEEMADAEIQDFEPNGAR